MTTPITGSIDESLECKQLAEMQTEVRRLGNRLDRVSTSNVRDNRSPTPERRVAFNLPPRRSNPGQSLAWHRQQPTAQHVPPGRSSFSRMTSPIAMGNTYTQPTSGVCNRCGKPSHIHSQYCPALGKTCAFCNKANHFARMCKSAARQQSPQNQQSQRILPRNQVSRDY